MKIRRVSSMQSLIKNTYLSADEVCNDIFSQKESIYTFLNPVSYLDARKNKQLFEKFDGIFIDGSILVRAIKAFYGKKIKRRSFDMTSIAPTLFNYSIENDKSIYIVGSMEDEIQATLNILKTNYPELNIIGYRNGYFNGQKETEEEYNKIISISPDFLIVGMGILHQERFLVGIKKKGYKGIGFTCGGFISQTAKGENELDYYPGWVDKYNVRFLYRMYKEKHTRKRYLKAAFIFPVLFVKDWIIK